MLRKSYAALPAVAIAMIAAHALTAPQPSETSGQWQLDASFEDIHAIRVQLAGDAAPKTFWYMRYTVANNTGQDRVFVPEFILYTDSGEVLRSGHRTPSAVFQAIKALYNDPLLQDVSGMTGKLLQGQDNAKSGVAIWQDFDPQAGAFDVFVSGLSGEMAEVALPKPLAVTETDAMGNRVEVVKVKIILSKTLQRHYQVEGRSDSGVGGPAKFVSETWVMR
jgi:hypothetical protein